MLRLIAPLFAIVGLLMGGAGTPASSIAPGYRTSFCPECWKFLSDPWDVDLQGRCTASGKVPVDVEAVKVGWFWCRSHQAWHRRPCSKEPWSKASERESVALLVSTGSETTFPRAYCPEDRALSAAENIGLKCPVCARPFVRVQSVERRWYWCASRKVWATEPCAMNSTLHCDKLRSGMVLAYSWFPPILNSIGFGDSLRGELRVDAEWLAKHLDDPHLVVLHIGFNPLEPGMTGRSTYSEGHILGAQHVAWSEIAMTRRGIPEELPPAENLTQMVRSLGIDIEDRIILYDTGSGLEAARAYLTLDYLGLGNNAALLDGHWARWKALNLPETRMPWEVEPSAFVPRLHPEILLSLSTMQDLSWACRETPSSFALIDARPPEEFAGVKSGKGILRPGHIPGAMNLFWMDTLESPEDPILRPENELRAMFEASGARPGRTVVVYCRTGVEASHLYFVAKYLGYPALFFDGSYFEWSQDGMPTQGSWAFR